MPTTISRTGLLALTVLILAADGGAQISFSSTVCFGDSLTDNTRVPKKWRVRYGRDPVELVFNRGKKEGDKLTVLARGGSTSADIGRQFAHYLAMVKARKIPEATLVSYQTGGNDLVFFMWMLKGKPPGKSRLADLFIKRLIKANKEHLDLATRYVPTAHLLVWTLPDVTLTPALHKLPADQKKNLRAHVGKVNDALRKRAKASANITLLDLDVIWNRLKNDPPLIAGRKPAFPPRFGDPDCVFADPIHPSAACNAFIANHAIGLLAKKAPRPMKKLSEQEILRIIAGQ